MDNVTAKFRKYNLDKISRKFEEDLTWSPKVQYSRQADRYRSLRYPMTEADIQNIGGEVEQGDQWKAEYYQKPGLEAHYCSVHKATIPISAMRQLIDQDHQDQMVTFNCSSCTQWETCKRSPCTTAISIQEKREQEVI